MEPAEITTPGESTAALDGAIVPHYRHSRIMVVYEQWVVIRIDAE
jgi:hypothetical protein